jgi:hypothetical protein
MNLGDDISNLLRNIGPDAGVYQDLTQYNASRLARRGGRPSGSAQAQAHMPLAEPGQDPDLAGDGATAALLQRLADGPDAAACPQPDARLIPALVPAADPQRLDRLFARLEAQEVDIDAPR